jgi:hypothetical protein
MLTSWNWIWSWDITIRINIAASFGTCNALQVFKGSFFRITFFHYHSIWVGSCWDNHSSISAASHYSPVVHNVLGEVFFDVPSIWIFEFGLTCN